LPGLRQKLYKTTSTSSAEKLFALGGEQREAEDLGVSLAQLGGPDLGPESTSYVKIQPSAGLELMLKCNHSHAVPFQEAAASLPSSSSPGAGVKPAGSWRRPDSGLCCRFPEGRGRRSLLAAEQWKEMACGDGQARLLPTACLSPALTPASLPSSPSLLFLAPCSELQSPRVSMEHLESSLLCVHDAFILSCTNGK